MAVSVKRKHVLADRLIDDGVGIGLARRDLAGHFQRLQIKKHNLLDSLTWPRITVGDEAFAEVFGDGDSMTARQAADLPHYRIAVCIEDDHLRAVRHVHAPRLGVDGNVVVILISAGRWGQGYCLDQVIT